MSEKESLIQAIMKQRTEIAQARERIETLNKMKADVEGRAKNLEAIVANKAVDDAKAFSNEKSYALKKEIEDEETIKTCSSEKWGSVRQGKLELERKVQAEEEFISRNLKKRMLAVRKQVTTLRMELIEKQKLVGELCLRECNADMKEQVESCRSKISSMTQQLADLYENERSLEEKRDRLKNILENITDRRKGQSQAATHMSFDSKRRRSNFAVPKKHFVPAMRIQK